MNEQREPLPCPFCGPGNSEVEAYYDDLAHRYRVGCGRCGSSTGITPRADEDGKEVAIARWNKRGIHPPGEASEGDIEALAWKLCPILQADDECDMPEILNGPHPECRRCEMGVERNGGTAGCRLVANVVARAAIAALPAPPEREALKEALALLVKAGDQLEGYGIVSNTLDRAREKLGALLGEEK